jgi:hypothetical protein
MSRENKYNPYTSQQPTDGDPSSRAFKRRKWRDNWQYYLAKDNMKYCRELRRLAWKTSKEDFRDIGKEVAVND